jgi:putative methyltransferase (TIGR04325 family)
MRLRDFVPPIAITGARLILPRRTAEQASHLKQVKFRSYEDALRHCSPEGYENPDIVNVVLEKTKRYRDRLEQKRQTLQIDSTSAYSLCSILATLDSNEINVIDFGGACGAHYFLARAFLPKKYKLRWHVVETTRMASRAQEEISNAELSFSDDFEETAASVKNVDLLHTSGAIQCVEDPVACLQMLTSVESKYILFNRLGMTPSHEPVITIHESWLSMNGPGPMPEGLQDQKVRYPFAFPSESVVYETLAANYDIIMTFDDRSGCIPVGNEPVIGLGILAKHKSGKVD